MSYCLNPSCHKPQNSDNANFCQSCGSKLLLRERYRALKKIGQGGFGRTFLAIDEDKPSKPYCVIKQFYPQAQGTETLEKAVKLFSQEAVRLDDLGKHPQIPELLAHFEQDSRQYLVQEFIDGKNLNEELREKGAFSGTQIKGLLNSLLPILDFIHTHHVIHRDIKPENIIRHPNGELVLVDFGAAKFSTKTSIAVTGTVIGSAGYTAPEQAVGKAIFASDIYSLGVTCIHLLTGVNNPFQLFDVGEYDWVWRDYLSRSISTELGEILDKMLKSATNQRYQSAQAILKDLKPQVSKQKSFQQNQVNAERYYQQGLEKAQRGNYTEAINLLSQAITLNSNYPSAYKFRGLAYSRINERQSAIADFKKAAEISLSLGKTDDCQDLLERIKKLQNVVIPIPKRKNTWSNQSAKVIGIDLGTTNSCVAVMEGGKPTVIANAEGFRTTPSIVAYTSNGDCLVGQAAKRQAIQNPENTFSFFMRFIGCLYDEVVEEVEQVPYKVLSSENGTVKFNCPALNYQFSPEEVLAQLLCKLADDASSYLGAEVTKAEVAIPAYFNRIQRQMIRDAGRIAGLEVLRIINQPTAAALCYGFDKENFEMVILFNLGGANCDASVVGFGYGVFEVFAICGDSKLGGDAFDQKIITWIIQEFKKTKGINLNLNHQTKQRLLEAANKAKIELSSARETEINLPYIAKTEFGDKHFKRILTRANFEILCSDLLDKCRMMLALLLQNARENPSSINKVLLLGGCTRTPMIQQLIEGIFSQSKVQSINGDEAVAIGAAIQGGVLAGEVKDILLMDVISVSSGIESSTGEMIKILRRNTTIPTIKSEVLSIEGDNQGNVEIQILEGEQELAQNNKRLGILRLDNLRPSSERNPEIKVTFDVDANGILTVSAQDKATGIRKSATF